MRHGIFSFGLSALYSTGAYRLAAPRFRGLGAILMLHHVRPFQDRAFAPNRGLEVEPEFLETALKLIARLGYEIIRLDDLPGRLAAQASDRPFIVLTLDDGYRDNVAFALPIFRKYKAPFTVYVTTGFADGTAPLWWIDLEAAIDRLPSLDIEVHGTALRSDLATPGLKQQAFEDLMRLLSAGPEIASRRIAAEIIAKAGIDGAAETRKLCLGWNEIARLANEPLATIGAHTMSHPALSKCDTGMARQEIEESKSIIAKRLGREIRHFAYPYGSPALAGRRDFALAESAGFSTAVTTRPGLIFAEHAAHLHALPRLSLNGFHQREQDLETLLSGLPFALLNRGRRLNVA
jgi:peptidoglycan/xylan/chitin deacetylase (PgdA/CDA1 family)